MENHRLLFIGGQFLDRFAPSYNNDTITMKLISTRPDDSRHLVDDCWEVLPEISSDAIIRFARDNRITGILSKIDAERETSYLRDAVVKEVLEKEGVRFFGQGMRSATISMDKAIQREVFEAHGLPILKGGVANNWVEVQRLAGNLFYPLVLKAPVGAISLGVVIVKSAEELEEAYLSLGTPRVVIEQFMEGIEIGLEALVWDGQMSMNPCVYLGETSIQSDPHRRFRLCPFLPAEVEAKAERLMERIVSCMGADSLIQVDTVYVPASGQFHILEVNARFNGMSDLTAWASDLNVFDAAVRCVTGTWEPKRPEAIRVAVELPVELTPAEQVEYVESSPLVRHTRLHQGKGLIHLSSDDADEVLAFISTLPTHVRQFDTADFQIKFEQAVQALKVGV